MNKVARAMLKAADHIEKDPGALHMGKTAVPCGLGEEACIMAWTAHFMGVESGKNVDTREVNKLLGFSYSQMSSYMMDRRRADPLHDSWQQGRYAPKYMRELAKSHLVVKRKKAVKKVRVAVKVKEAVHAQ